MTDPSFLALATERGTGQMVVASGPRGPVKRHLLAVALMLLLSGCGYGDRGFDVTFKNEFEREVTVLAYGVTNAATTQYTLPARQSLARTWQYPGMDERRRVRVVATAEGQQIFCKDYSFDELRVREFTIVIRAGEAC